MIVITKLQNGSTVKKGSLYNLYLKNVTPKAIYDLLVHEKKVKQGKLRFVLPDSIGSVSTYEVINEDLVLNAISTYIKDGD